MAVVAVQKRETFWDQIQEMEQRVMRRAEEIFRRDGIFGKDLDNWLSAERELVWRPAIELTENGKRFQLQANVAGIDAKDLQVEATANDLLIKGQMRKEEKKSEGKTCISEFHSGSLFRAIHFPKRVNPAEVKAELKNGILVVTAPIVEGAPAEKRKVAVTVR